MPVFLRLVSHDDVFANLDVQPVILNDLNNRTEEDRDYFDKLVSETYTSDMVSMLPTCRCGHLKGEHHRMMNVTCDICKTPVSQPIEDDIRPHLWFRRPRDQHGNYVVEKLINLHILTMLSRRFKKSGYETISWLINRDYTPTVKEIPVIQRMRDAGIERGYNFFVRNFDDILNFLFADREFKSKKSVARPVIGMLGFSDDENDKQTKNLDPLQVLIQQNRDRIFSDVIPLPNRSILIIEKNVLGTFIDEKIIGARDAMNMMLSIDKDYHDQSVTTKENRTAKALLYLSKYYVSYIGKNMSSKPGTIRQNLSGCRSNHAFRAVITSHEDIHHHDEIYVPWGVGVTVFHLHLMNKLMKEGFIQNDALRLLYEHVHIYHPLLHAKLNELIEESPHKGIPVMQMRNPSLMQGSSQLVYITKFKTNTQDTTVSMSDLIATAYNADYDGDELMHTLPLDEKMTRMMYPLSPFFNLLLLTKPYEISSNLSMSDPIIASISHWMEEEEEEEGITS